MRRDRPRVARLPMARRTLATGTDRLPHWSPAPSADCGTAWTTAHRGPLGRYGCTGGGSDGIRRRASAARGRHRGDRRRPGTTWRNSRCGRPAAAGSSGWSIDADGGVDAGRGRGRSAGRSRERLDESGADDPTGSAPYTLEVTSPGIGRPLTLPRHFRRAADQVGGAGHHRRARGHRARARRHRRRACSWCCPDRKGVTAGSRCRSPTSTAPRSRSSSARRRRPCWRCWASTGADRNPTS